MKWVVLQIYPPASPSLVLNVDFNTCEWNELYYKYIRRLRQNKESRLQLIHRATQSLGLLGSSWQFKRFIKWRQFLTRGRELKVMSQQQRWLSTTRVDKEQRQLNSRELARGWVIDRFKTISINLAHATSLKLLLIFQYKIIQKLKQKDNIKNMHKIKLRSSLKLHFLFL